MISKTHKHAYWIVVTCLIVGLQALSAGTCLPYMLLYPQQPRQCLAHNRSKVNLY